MEFAAVITKSPGTGGLVTPQTVAEQMLDEIAIAGRARRRLRFHRSALRAGRRASGAGGGCPGRPPTDTYKVSTTFADGFARRLSHDRHRPGPGQGVLGTAR
jgi:hypothetical protein